MKFVPGLPPGWGYEPGCAARANNDFYLLTLQAADALPDALQEAVRGVDGLATGFVVEKMDATAADFEVVTLPVSPSILGDAIWRAHALFLHPSLPRPCSATAWAGLHAWLDRGTSFKRNRLPP